MSAKCAFPRGALGAPDRVGGGERLVINAGTKRLFFFKRKKESGGDIIIAKVYVE